MEFKAGYFALKRTPALRVLKGRQDEDFYFLSPISKKSALFEAFFVNILSEHPGEEKLGGLL